MFSFLALLSKSLGHGGLWLHLIRFLQARRSGAETVPDLFTPGSIDEMFRLLEHRLWLEIAIGIDLTCGDSRQCGIDRFGIKLSTREGKLRVVEQPLGRIVLPTLPRLEAAVVETREEGSRIHGCNLDSELLEFKTHRLRDRLDGMLRGRIDAGERVRIQALSRRYPHNTTLAAFDHLLGDPLGQQQGPDHVDLKLMTHIRRWDVEDGAAFQNAGIVHQNLDIKGECFFAISLICHVKLLDLKGDTARGRLAFQGLDLGPDLDCGDYIESFLRKSHCGLMSEARACSCNQDPLHGCLL